jgi:hypothetical protein
MVFHAPILYQIAAQALTCNLQTELTDNVIHSGGLSY